MVVGNYWYLELVLDDKLDWVNNTHLSPVHQRSVQALLPDETTPADALSLSVPPQSFSLMKCKKFAIYFSVFLLERVLFLLTVELFTSSVISKLNKSLDTNFLFIVYYTLRSYTVFILIVTEIRTQGQRILEPIFSSHQAQGWRSAKYFLYCLV